MKIYDVLDDEGRPSSFEVSNFFLRRRGALRIVRYDPRRQRDQDTAPMGYVDT